MPQFIFTMKDLRKVTPQGKEILKGIWLSFYGDAKIGVLGAQRRRQETLLRIMAGVDKDFAGEAFPAAGHAHRLPAPGAAARPEEERARSTSRRRWRTSARSCTRYEELSANYVGRDRATSHRRGCRTRSTPQNLWELDRTSRSPWTRCACRRATPTSPSSRAASGAASRSAGCCSSRSDMLLLDEPTNHLDAESVAWLERFLKEYKGSVVAVTHDRYFLDNVAGWILELDRGAGIPWEGNYSSWLDQKKTRAGPGREGRVARASARLQRELEWVRMAPRARQAKGKARLAHYEELLAEEQAAEKREGAREISIPPGPAPRRPRDRGQGPAQGLRRQPADGRRQLHPAPRRHRRRDRPERRGQDDALPHDRGPGEARRGRAARSARRVALSYVDQSRDSARRRPHGLGGDLGRRQGPRDGRQARGELARLRRAPSTSAAPTSRRR